MFVNQWLELTQVSSTPSQWVKRCQQDFTRDGSLTLIWRNSRIYIIDLAVLRIYSSLSTKNQDQNAKLRVFLRLETKRKLTVIECGRLM